LTYFEIKKYNKYLLKISFILLTTIIRALYLCNVLAVSKIKKFHISDLDPGLAQSSESLRIQVKKCQPSGCYVVPRVQVCDSLSRLSSCPREPVEQAELVEVVRVVEAWAPLPEQVQGVVHDWDR
jgi:hypothetical protein